MLSMFTSSHAEKPSTGSTNEILIGVISGVVAGVVAPTIFQLAVLSIQWLRRPQLAFSTEFSLHGLRRPIPSFIIILTNRGSSSANNVTVRLDFPSELAVAITTNDPLNAPEVEIDGQHYSRFEHHLERPLVKNYPYRIGEYYAQRPPRPETSHRIRVIAWMEGYGETKQEITFPRPPVKNTSTEKAESRDAAQPDSSPESPQTDDSSPPES